ncbi:MAG: GNAT family N-acetyltransferase [Halocynthiibacter sp.]
MKQDSIIQSGAIDAAGVMLRPVVSSDRGLLKMYTSDKRVSEMTSSIPHPLPPGVTKAFIDRAIALENSTDEAIWIMDGSASGLPEVVGVISLKNMDRDQSELGMWVAPAFWNSGIATRAVEALIAENPLKNKTIFAGVFQDNPGSARVLTKCGFEYLGDAEAFSIARAAKVTTWTYIKKMDG